MTTFTENKTYKMRFITDSDLIVPVTIIKRTVKTATYKIRNREAKKSKIYNHNGVEYIFPEGNYSMAPTCHADKLYV